MRVLIIGGGIGGLTAAIALARRGIDAEVFEKSPAFREVGAGIALWPNAAKALRKLGLGDALDAISLVNREGALLRWNGDLISRTPVSDFERQFGGGVIVLHRAELLEMLAQHVGSTRIHLAHECIGIDQDQQGVTAKFANGTVVRADFLAGADGLHSIVRKWLGHDDQIRYHGYTGYRSVVDFDSSEMMAGETWGCGLRFGMLPVRGGRVYWFAVHNAPERDPVAEASRARLLSLFRGWHQPVEALIRAADEGTILRNNIYDRDPLGEWGRGRVTMLGDAAHPMTPNLGQGGCQAIEDALVMAASLSGDATEAGLRQYEARRIPRTGSVVLASRRFGTLGQIENPLLCRLRDLAFRMAPNSVTIRGLQPWAAYEDHLED